MLSQIFECGCKFARYLIEHSSGDVYFACVAKPLQPRRKIYAVAMDIVVFYDYVANVDAHAKNDALVLRYVVILLTDRRLYVQGVAYSVDRARELDQHTVARHLYDPPAISGDLRVN